MLTSQTGLSEQTLSQIVTKNFKAAAIFEKYNLDFCCRGNRPLSEACEAKGVDTEVVLDEINNINGNGAISDSRFENWELDFLIDYIINNHHQYVRNMIPVISTHTDKVAKVHGENHPEMIEVANNFEIVYKDLKQHMMKEEEILFPYVKFMVKQTNNGGEYEAPFFGTVDNPIKMMEAEHETAGDLLYKIRELTNNYSIPEDACNTFRVCLQELKDFEEDLHKHVHLENNILFPKSKKLELELKSEA